MSFLPEMDDGPPSNTRPAPLRASSSSLKKSFTTNFKFGSTPDALTVPSDDRLSPRLPSPTLPYFDRYPRSSSRTSDNRMSSNERLHGYSKAAGKQREDLRSSVPPVSPIIVERRRERAKTPTPIPNMPAPDRSRPPTSMSVPGTPATSRKSPSSLESNPWGIGPREPRSPRSPRSPTFKPAVARSSMSPLHRSEHSDSSGGTIPATPTSPALPEPYMVTAPFPASVEAMDALVDQMNGDLSQPSTSSGYKPSKRRGEAYSRHALYAPPLPKPPEGVKLGVRHRKVSEDSIEGRDEQREKELRRERREREKEKERKERKERERKERTKEKERDAERDKEKDMERERRHAERQREKERAVEQDLERPRDRTRDPSRPREKRREGDPERRTTPAAERRREAEFAQETVRVKERRREDPPGTETVRIKDKKREPERGTVAEIPPPSPALAPSTRRDPSDLAVPKASTSRSVARSPVNGSPRVGLPPSKTTPNIYSLAVPDQVMDTNPSLDDIIKNYVSRGDSPANLSAPVAHPVTPKPKLKTDALEPFPMSPPTSVTPVSPTESVATRAVPPSISEIIRVHAPAVHKVSTSSRPRTAQRNVSFTTLPSPSRVEQRREEEEVAENRSSMDSVAEEVQRALKAENGPKALHHSRSLPNRPGTVSASPSQTQINGDASPGRAVHAARGPSESYTPSIDSNFAAGTSFLPIPSTTANGASSETLAIAQQLRSPRLTRLLTLKRSPHRGLTVSLADVGSATGHPVFVFLGLGCVRYLVGLYDEMAEALGLRLVCVDRWGLGRTDDVPAEKRGLLEWAAVMEEVADVLEIGEFSVMAHSAGAPYSLATGLRMGKRLVGSVHLLAPWVSTAVEGGYKWLKYVPNGLIKTAQAAEWKVQGWMLGKPPTITYQGIGYDVKTGVSLNADGRPSFQFSDYDDLADFDGRYSSAVSLPGRPPSVQPPPTPPVKTAGGTMDIKRKTSRSILGIFGSKAGSIKSPRNSTSPTFPPKSKGDKGATSSRRESNAAQSTYSSATLPLNLPTIEPDQAGLGIKFDTQDDHSAQGSTLPPRRSEGPPTSDYPRAGRRSISLTSRSSSRAAILPLAFPSPRLIQRAATSPPGNPSQKPTSKSMSLADALMRASHAESLKGGTADLLAILERDSKPWGFAYTDVRQPVLVWYGERDEKISIASVRWMERAMHDCKVKIIPDTGHSLLMNARVVVEVLESIARQCGHQQNELL